VLARLASSTMSSWPAERVHFARAASRSLMASTWRGEPARPAVVHLGVESLKLTSALALEAVLVEELGDIVGIDVELEAEHLGGSGRGGETENRPGAVVGLPGGLQTGHCGRLAAAGGGGEQIEHPARGCDVGDGSGLVGAEGEGATGQQGGGDAFHGRGRDGGCPQFFPSHEEAVLGVEDEVGTVEVVGARREARRAVETAKEVRDCVQLGSVEKHRHVDAAVGDGEHDGFSLRGGGESPTLEKPV
jgi:hypothetical protein